MTFSAKFVTIGANKAITGGMLQDSFAYEPITVSSSVHEQMFLYLTGLEADIDAFLRSIGIDPSSVRPPDASTPYDLP